MATKICRICNTEKTIEEFNVNKSNKDGHETRCKECDRNYRKEYRTKNKDIIKEKVRQKYLQDPLKHILQVHISLSKTNGIPCDTYDVLYDHLYPIFNKMECEHCGMKFKPGNDTKRNYSPSLDRLIPHKGYVVGNIAVLCHDCNRRKQDISVEEMQELIDWVKWKIEYNNQLYCAS